MLRLDRGLPISREGIAVELAPVRRFDGWATNTRV